MSDAFTIPDFPEFPEFDGPRQLNGTLSESELVLGLAVIGLLLLPEDAQRKSRDFQQALMSALAVFLDESPTLDDLERCADALNGDPRQACKDAGTFIRKALLGYREASTAQDEYAFADVVHWAVGALEEVACRLPGVKAKTLGQAVKQLEGSETISPGDREWLEEIYRLRSENRGIGHGAGGAPEYVATYVLFSVRAGLDLFLPLLQLPKWR